MTRLERMSQYPNQITTAYQKKQASQDSQQRLDAAKKSVADLTPQVASAKSELLALQAKYDKAAPAAKKKLAPALAEAQAKYKGLQEKFDSADVQVFRLGRSNPATQAEALGAQKAANDTAKELKLELPFPLVDGFESMEEARSMSAQKYQQAIGGAPARSGSVSAQVGALKQAAATPAGPQTLADKLKNLDPTAQKQILEGSKAEIDAIATRVAKGYSKDVVAYADAVKNLDPALRSVLVKALASKVSVSEEEAFRASRDDSNIGFPTALKVALKSGTGAELLGPLLTELKSAGNTRAATAVATEASEAIRDIRSDFGKKHAVALDLQGDLARLMYGYKESLSPTELSAGIEAFKSKHFSEFKDLETSVGSAMDIVKQLDTLPLEYGDLKAQAKKLKGDVPELLTTTAGEKELKKAIKSQVLGNPSLLDNINKWASEGGDLAGMKEKLSKIAVSTAAVIALEGGGITKGSVVEFLKRNKTLLNLETKGVNELAAAMKALDPDNPASQVSFKDSIKKLSPETGKVLTGLGIALALPGVISGWRDFNDADKAGKLKTLLETAKTGAEAGEFLITAFSKSESLLGLGKSLGAASKVLGVAGTLLSGADAIASFASGDVVGGASKSMSTAGGLLMLGGPAGIATGAALILGGYVVQKVWGKDPAEEAEKADEADAKTFLKAGGLSEKLATGLSDLLQSNRRNVGTFVNQMAREFQLTPAEFLKHLDKLTPGQLKELVSMAKGMPADVEWKYQAKKKAGDKLDRAEVVGELPVPNAYVGPRSIQNAAEWMKSHKMAPPLPPTVNRAP